MKRWIELDECNGLWIVSLVGGGVDEVLHSNDDYAAARAFAIREAKRREIPSLGTKAKEERA